MKEAYNSRSTEALLTPPCPSPQRTVGGGSRMAISKPIPESVLSRPDDFWALAAVDMYDADACWPWRGFTTIEGYGRFNRGFAAHRVAYTLIKGAIPVGLTIDHLCGNRSCVNPAHLEAVTITENRRRGVASPSPRKYPARKRTAERFHRRRARGVCVQCNTPSTKYRCDRCREIHNERNKGRAR